MVYWPLGLTAFLFVGLLVVCCCAEGDHLFGTQFGDAFTNRLGIRAQDRISMACPVCFGGEDTVMRESLNAGIGVLMGVTAIVLACFARFIVTARAAVA